MTITVLLILLGLYFKRSYFLSGIIFLWQYILIGFNYAGADMNDYLNLYQTYGNKGGIDLSLMNGGLYQNLMFLFSLLRLDFVSANAIISFFALVLLHISIKRYTKNINFVHALLFIYPFTDLVIQKRNFIAMAIIIYAIKYLREKEIAKTIKYLILCVIAFGFHESALFYIILAILPWVNFEFIKKYMLLFDVVFIFIFPWFFSHIMVFFTQSKISLYLEDSSNRLGIFKVGVFIVLHCILVFITLWFNQEKKSVFNRSRVNKYNGLFTQVIFFSLLFIPLYYYNSTFFRFVRNLLIIFYANVANFQSVGYIFTKSVLIKNIVYISFLFSLFMFFYVFFGDLGFSYLVKPIFEYNRILDFFY
ncbi:EpsG family protein [Enterococcus sp. FSL R5-0957]|uniref:EpsG family protein n=1 Tax=Enterococcus sp. FSL R5-0957 TaxID=2921725 RepID=UPI0030F598F9